MVTEKQILASAKRIGCKSAAIKAVIEVESGGNGFLDDGTPKILFEPHIFWKELRKRNIDPVRVLKKDPSLRDILYPTWKTGQYGRVNQQHERLQRAVKVHREAALMSASWGLFQILGNNWGKCGVKTFQEFITAMYESEDRHLDMFDDYICNTYLDDELKNLDWRGFASGYNGQYYWKNKYDIKLRNAFVKYNK